MTEQPRTVTQLLQLARFEKKAVELSANLITDGYIGPDGLPTTKAYMYLLERYAEWLCGMLTDFNVDCSNAIKERDYYMRILLANSRLHKQDQIKAGFMNKAINDKLALKEWTITSGPMQWPEGDVQEYLHNLFIISDHLIKLQTALVDKSYFKYMTMNIHVSVPVSYVLEEGFPEHPSNALTIVKQKIRWLNGEEPCERTDNNIIWTWDFPY